MADKYILAIDQSTAGTKALLVNCDGSVSARADRPHAQKISNGGWVAHDPTEIYINTIAAVSDAIKINGINPEAIVGAGLCNQRETAMVWDRRTGLPIYDAVVWQCARGGQICAAMGGDASRIQKATGLRLSPYFSAAKIAWILQNAGYAGSGADLCAGTIDSWLIYKLTGNFKTDVSNASRTQLMNLHSLQWDDDICGLFGIYPSMLGEICHSDSMFGMTNFGGALPSQIPIHAAMGDSHAALYGQGCHTPGMGKATYGTGSSVMFNIGGKPVICENLTTSLAWGFDGRAVYVVEGNINYTGAVIKWLADDLGLLDSPAMAGELAAQANPGDLTYLVPAFTGLGAPYWSGEARAVMVGMGRGTGKAEIIKAAEECIAYQIADVVQAVKDEAGLAVGELRVDGGPTRDGYLMQFQSDILNAALSVPGAEELSAVGAAYMAGIALGLYDESIFDIIPRVYYYPSMPRDERAKRLAGWHAAVKKALTQ